LRALKLSIVAAALGLAVLAPAGSALAYGSCYVDGYTRSDGTYVSGHYRSCPDSSTSNNWSTRGNTNPWTGEAGTRSPSYGSGYGSGYRSYWP